MSVPFDRNGQPPPAIHVQQNTDKDIQELLGMLKGIACDGVVNAEEAIFLSNWLEDHIRVWNVWPASVLVDRVRHMLSNDGVIDTEERADLLDTMKDLLGINDALSSRPQATKLPLNDPPPVVWIPQRTICLTGTFEAGSRVEIAQRVERWDGIVHGSVKVTTQYLVIGKMASRDWVHSSYGRKIESAVKHREVGKPIAIVSEDLLVEAFRELEKTSGELHG